MSRFFDETMQGLLEAAAIEYKRKKRKTMFDKFKSLFYAKCQVNKKDNMKIRFKKAKKNIKYINAYLNKWNEIEDSSIVRVLNEIKDKYNFEILNVSIEDANDYSLITISCNKEDKFDIFAIFCEILGEHVTEVEMK